MMRLGKPTVKLRAESQPVVSTLNPIMKLAGSQKLWCRFVFAGLLAIHTGLLAYSASVHSPTYNEPGHLVAGISYWQFGRFDIYKVNPPLSRLVAALPVLAVGCKTDWSQYYDGPGARPEMALGEAFVHANGERSIWLFTIARWACIPFSLIGGYIVFRWSRALYGTAAGILSLTLWCFCPNILAHGSLITPDMAATAMGAAACYKFWHWLRQPTWWNVLICGAVLGLAELSKTTLILLFFAWPAMWLAYRIGNSRGRTGRNWLRELGMLAVCAIVAVYVLNLGYGFEGSFTPLGKYRFISDSLGAESGADHAPNGGGNRFEHSWLAALPVPLPKNYLQGIEVQKRDFEDYGSKSYLNGVWSDHGWWYYYLEALAIKVPLGTWLLLALAATRRFWWRRAAGDDACTTKLAAQARGLAHFAMSGEQNVPVPLSPPSLRDEFVLLFPALVILTFVSSQTGFNEHMRYVLPIFPFFFIWIGRVAVAFASRQRIISAIAGAALAWSIASSLWIYPHSLSYFNELAGGPLGGPRYLLGSNIDWGQDLLFLKRWLAEHPEAKPLKLAYFGPADPSDFGIQYTAPEEFSENQTGAEITPIPPGWYAISVNFVGGTAYSSFKGDGTKTSFGENAFARFRQIKPIATAGYSIIIYRIAGPALIGHERSRR